MNRTPGISVAAFAAAGLMLLAGGCADQATAPPKEPLSESPTLYGSPTDPLNRAKVHTELASLYYSRGNMAVALEELRAATQADPDYALAYSMFGLVYMDLHEVKLAEQNFQRALQLAPTDPDINHNYGLFLCENGRETDSIGYFMRAVRNPLYNRPWRSYTAAGTCALRKGNTKDAESYFEHALRLDANDPPALLQLGRFRYHQGRLDEARTLVSRYNKVVSPTAESLWLALRIERKLGEHVAEASYANQLRRRFAGSKEYQQLQRGEYD